MELKVGQTKLVAALVIFAAGALGLFFQNCSSRLSTFTPANSTIEVGSPQQQPTQQELENGGSQNSGGATGTSTKTCDAGQELVGGACTSSCLSSQERVNGLCVSKCSSDKERVGDVCANKCASTEERINNLCVAKCASTEERINGICTASCLSNQERINGVCSAVCASTEERINGSCVSRCQSNEERINGSCVAKCSSTDERINGTCVAKCPAEAPRGVNGQCGVITKGAPSFISIFAIQNATACGPNETSIPLVSNENGIVTYRMEQSPFGCISPQNIPIEIKYGAADGRCISGCGFSFQYTDNYMGAVARILPMLSTLQSDSYAPGVIYSAKNLYYHSSVPAKDEIKCQVSLHRVGYSEDYNGDFILKRTQFAMAPAGNGYGTTPTLYTSKTADKSFHMYSMEWHSNEFPIYNSLDWDRFAPLLSDPVLERSHFIVYQNDGELLGGSVVLGLDRVYNQYEIDKQRLFAKIMGHWMFERADLKPANMTKDQIFAALRQINGYDQIASLPYTMSVTCPQSLLVYKVREP